MGGNRVEVERSSMVQRQLSRSVTSNICLPEFARGQEDKNSSLLGLPRAISNGIGVVSGCLEFSLAFSSFLGFSRVFLSCLEFSWVLSSFIELSRVFSGFLALSSTKAALSQA